MVAKCEQSPAHLVNSGNVFVVKVRRLTDDITQSDFPLITETKHRRCIQMVSTGKQKQCQRIWRERELSAAFSHEQTGMIVEGENMEPLEFYSLKESGVHKICVR